MIGMVLAAVDIPDVVAAAVRHAPNTRPDRYTILEHLDLDAEEVRRRVDGYVRSFSS